MPVPWAKVEQNPQYQSLTEEDKEAARQQYFANMVSPLVPEQDRKIALEQFLSDTQPAPVAITSTAAGVPQFSQAELEESEIPTSIQEFELPPLPTNADLVDGGANEQVKPKPTALEEFPFPLPKSETLGRLQAAMAGVAREFGKGITLGQVDIYDSMPVLKELEAKYLQPDIPINHKDPILEKVRKQFMRDPAIITKMPARILGELLTIGKISRTISAIDGLPKTIGAAIGQATRTGGIVGLLRKPEKEGFAERVKNGVEHAVFFAATTGVVLGVNKIIQNYRFGKLKSIHELREAMYRKVIDDRGLPRSHDTIKWTDDLLDDMVKSRGGLKKMSSRRIRAALRRVKAFSVSVVGEPPATPPETTAPISPTIAPSQIPMAPTMPVTSVVPSTIPVTTVVPPAATVGATEAQGKSIWDYILNKIKEFNASIGEKGEADIKKLKKLVKDIQDAELSPNDKEILLSGIIKPIALPVTPKIKSVAPTKIVKPLVRRTTGQIKIGNFLTDDRTALREVLKKEQQTSMKAFKVGKKEGVGIQKIHQQRIADAKSTRDALRHEINSLVSGINRLPTENLPVEYKNRINNIKQDFDLKKRSAKTLHRRQSMKQFIERQKATGEPINIPKEKLKVLDKKTLNDMSIDDLRDLNDIVSQIAHIGKTKGKLLKISEGKRVEGVVNEFSVSMGQVKGRKELPPDVPLTEQSKKQYLSGRTKEAIRTFIQKNDNLERTLEALDNYSTDPVTRLPNGPGYRYITKPIEDASAQSKRGITDKTAIIEELQKQLKIDVSKFISLPRKINDRITMTANEAAEVYLASFDEDKFMHLSLGQNLSEQDISDIVNSLTPAEKTFVEQVQKQYWQPQYNEINPVYEKLFNNTMPQIPGYSEIVVDKTLSDIKVYEESLVNELISRKGIRVARIERGFTKERVSGAKQPLTLDFLGNLYRNIEKTEHFKAFALPARDIDKILRHPRYKNDVIAIGGPNAYKQINKLFGNIKTNRPYLETSASPVIAMFRNHAVEAFLGFAPLTAAKQFPSLFTAGAVSYKGFPSVMRGVNELIFNRKKSLETMYSKSPMMMKRKVERDIAELFIRGKKSGIISRKAKLSRLAMSWIKAVDKEVTGAVWTGNYIDALKDMSDAKAVEWGNLVVRRSQPVWDVKDLGMFFTGGELEKMLTMFMSQRSQNWRIFRHDVVGKWVAGKTTPLEVLKKMWWLWVVPALTLGTIERGKFKRTPGEAAKDLTKYSPLGGLFLVGNVIDSALSGFDWNLAPFHGAQEVSRAIRSKDPKKIALHAAKGLGVLYGVPGTTSVTRTGQGVIDLLSGETDDLRRLIYSKYALETKPFYPFGIGAPKKVLFRDVLGAARKNNIKEAEIRKYMDKKFGKRNFGHLSAEEKEAVLNFYKEE